MTLDGRLREQVMKIIAHHATATDALDLVIPSQVGGIQVGFAEHDATRIEGVRLWVVGDSEPISLYRPDVFESIEVPSWVARLVFRLTPEGWLVRASEEAERHELAQRFQPRVMSEEEAAARALGNPSTADWRRFRPADLDQAEVDRRVSLAVRHICEVLGVPVEDSFAIDVTPGAVVIEHAEPRDADGNHPRRGDEAAKTRTGSTWTYQPNGRRTKGVDRG